MNRCAGNQATSDKLLDLHNGLHAAMDALIRDKDHAQASVILRQMDDAFRDLIDNMQVKP